MKKLLIFCLMSLISNLFSQPKSNINTNLYLLNLKNNQRVQLKQLLAKQKNLINFWSITCKPCKQEIPELLKLKEEFPQVQFLFINTDQNSAKKEVKEMAIELGIEELSLLDIYQKALLEFTGKNEVPATFIWNNKIIFQAIGYKEDTIQNIKKALIQ